MLDTLEQGRERRRVWQHRLGAVHILHRLKVVDYVAVVLFRLVLVVALDLPPVVTHVRARRHPGALLDEQVLELQVLVGSRS